MASLTDVFIIIIYFNFQDPSCIRNSNSPKMTIKLSECFDYYLESRSRDSSVIVSLNRGSSKVLIELLLSLDLSSGVRSIGSLNSFGFENINFCWFLLVWNVSVVGIGSARVQNRNMRKTYWRKFMNWQCWPNIQKQN